MENLGNMKLALIREILEISKRQLLLVDLEGLTPLLEKKAELIASIEVLDQRIAQARQSTGTMDQDPPWQEELNGLVEAILENERTMEERLDEEQDDVKAQLLALERQGQVRQYLDSAHRPGRSVNKRR